MAKQLIIWAEKYSVGYEEIDNQHKKLAGMINELYDSFVRGKADEVAETIIKEMIEYTDYHFKTEEKYFVKHNYSETQLHIEEHKGFVNQVVTFYEDLKKGSVTISYDVMNFLRDWLLEHIQGSDVKFGKEFKSRNITEL